MESAQQHLELKQMKEELTTRLTLVIEQVPIIIIVIILLTANFHEMRWYINAGEMVYSLERVVAR